MRIFCVLILSALEMTSAAAADSSHAVPRVPAWAKSAVWYQIFTERFANGDTANDPTPADISNAWPYNIPKGWHISPWTSDWYQLQPWEKADGHDFYWNAGVRRYGGDLQGIIDHLDYLKDLGITAIYLTPIFWSPSSHKYDTRMYHHIDCNFGPNPSEDEKIIAREDPGDPSTWRWTSADSLFLRMVREVHKRKMKIILDGVFNHVGTSFWAFQDVVKNQQASKYKDWFKIRSWDDPATPQNEFVYEGWNGVRELPEIKKVGTYDIADGFAEHVHAIVRRWMDPNGDGDPSDGIDGWRLDVAEKVSLKFWRQFRVWVKAENPQAYITGEIWWDNWPVNQMFNAAPWLQGDSFDGVMNYRFARAVGLFVGGADDKISPSAFSDTMTTLQTEYPSDNFYAVMNLLDSHDVDRVASQIVNPNRWYDHVANPGQNHNYKVRKPNEVEREKQRLIVGLQMTLPGAPMVYYGDEAGMWGGDDPDCRKPMVWPGLSYDIERTDPLDRPREPDTVVFDKALFDWYKKMIGIRNENRELSAGGLKFILREDGKQLLGYRRDLDGSTSFVFVNDSNAPASVSFVPEGVSREKGKLLNLIDGTFVPISNGACKLELAPFELKVLKPA
ncbi:MAG TPA: glycoside hydrolase family 13 protein [Bacteroidota bacterium]|nr:glycoside hydrolase family 13 protein [Bacteroidota bacterium]